MIDILHFLFQSLLMIIWLINFDPSPYIFSNESWFPIQEKNYDKILDGRLAAITQPDHACRSNIHSTIIPLYHSYLIAFKELCDVDIL